jgi:hypothetical protein
MTQKQNVPVTEAAIKSDPVAGAPQQMKGGAATKGKPCAVCSSCLKCRLASRKEIIHSAGPEEHVVKQAGSEN